MEPIFDQFIGSILRGDDDLIRDSVKKIFDVNSNVPASLSRANVLSTLINYKKVNIILDLINENKIVPSEIYNFNEFALKLFALCVRDGRHQESISLLNYLKARNVRIDITVAFSENDLIKLELLEQELIQAIIDFNKPIMLDFFANMEAPTVNIIKALKERGIILEINNIIKGDFSKLAIMKDDAIVEVLQNSTDLNNILEETDKIELYETLLAQDKINTLNYLFSVNPEEVIHSLNTIFDKGCPPLSRLAFEWMKKTIPNLTKDYDISYALQHFENVQNAFEYMSDLSEVLDYMGERYALLNDIIKNNKDNSIDFELDKKFVSNVILGAFEFNLPELGEYLVKAFSYDFSDDIVDLLMKLSKNNDPSYFIKLIELVPEGNKNIIKFASQSLMNFKNPAIDAFIKKHGKSLIHNPAVKKAVKKSLNPTVVKLFAEAGMKFSDKYLKEIDKIAAIQAKKKVDNTTESKKISVEDLQGIYGKGINQTQFKQYMDEMSTLKMAHIDRHGA